ncbi:MAG: ArsR family transcriptional regulator [Candidatus Aenigmarchaeota archaeon]|nr:ArsR family transcriptional regulator [Candidatus Aenigmarchaeota archaeon]NIQ17728.1 ArsR family transcriptional regulator [Candidatus Aenigmarchaeota archaeon]NIS73040.1 ArsR family transcriptional regulator [Candidatus Aenigmarchaeota archaeon]
MEAEGVSEAHLRRILWYVLAGTRGGLMRIRIIELIKDRPYNANQIKEALKVDYKTVQHHLKVLLENKILTTSEEKKYGSVYFLSPLVEKHAEIIDEIRTKLGKTK